MTDSQTIKLGSYFVLGIGFVVFLLGLGAVSYTHLTLPTNREV